MLDLIILVSVYDTKETFLNHFLFTEQLVHTVTKSPLKFRSKKIYLLRSGSLLL